MVARNQQANKMARSIPQTVGASSIANIESRTSNEAATAKAADGLKTGKNFTGQYLFDRFVANDKTEVTKLGIVREMAAALELDDFKAAVNGMVEIAASFRDKAIEAQKEAEGSAYNKDKPNADVAAYAARHKTAKNHQTVMRVSYGAIRFAPDALKAQGYDESTGYLVMQVIARKALAEAGIKWDGTKIPAQSDVERQRASQAETKALEKVMNANPRKPDENMVQYLARMGDKVGEQLAKDNAEREAKKIDDLAAQIRKMAGGFLDEVLDKLLNPAPPVVLDEQAAKAAAPAATKH